MFRALLTFALVSAGCTCGGPTTGAGTRATGPRTDAAWKGPDLGSAAHTSAIQLDQLPATWSFPEDNFPDGWNDAGVFEITTFTENQGLAGLWFGAPLPIQLPVGEKKLPEAIRVSVDGADADYAQADPGSAQSGARPKITWKIFNNQLAITAPTRPNKVVITSKGQAATTRLTWRLAKAEGLTVAGQKVPADRFDDAFAHYNATKGNISREGLLLPAPASATWTGVQIPEKAHFETWLTLASATLAPPSDGAAAVLSVVDGGVTTEVGRQAIAGNIEDFVAFKADLSAWANKKVDLILRTDPGANAVSDYVFAGSPAIVGKPDGEIRRLFVIGIDTTRPDHFGVNGYSRDTTPELDKWSQDAVIFDRMWTSAPRTRPSFRAATTGRLPLEAVCAPNISEAFDKAGFATAGIVSNIHLSPHFEFNRGFDTWWLDGKAQVDDQVSRAMAWMKEHEDRDTYMFLHVMDPHIFYKAPEPFADKFSAGLPPLSAEEQLPRMFNRWRVYQWQKAGKLTENRKAHITAQYDAELAWTSHELIKLLDYIDSLPGKNLVIIHNDHGEELWEHDGFEHNHTLYNDVTGGLLWIKPPGGTGQKSAHSTFPATLQDIAPTVYAFAGLEGFQTDGQSLLPALRGDADTGWTRPIPIGHLQYGVSRWGLVWDDHKYIVFTGSGEEELYDLKADPGEHTNLAGKVDTQPWWSRLGEAHSMDAGLGWRVTIDLEKRGPVEVVFPAPVKSAGVIDPEYLAKHPANQEWGEQPKRVPADVGTVELSGDRTSMKITPGRQGNGVLYVRFEDDKPLDLTEVRVSANGAEQAPDGEGKVTLGHSTLAFAQGVVVIPPEPEHERMKTCSNGELSADEMQMMIDLGYADKNEAPK